MSDPQVQEPSEVESASEEEVDQGNNYSEDFEPSVSEKLTSAFSNSIEQEEDQEKDIDIRDDENENEEGEELNAGVLSVMSTIEEEKTPSASGGDATRSGSINEMKQRALQRKEKDGDDSSSSLSRPPPQQIPEDRVPDELKGLQHYFVGDNDDISVESSAAVSKTESKGDESENKTMGSSGRSQSSSKSGPSQEHSSKSQSEGVTASQSESAGIAEILEKLDRLTNAQTILENVLEGEAEMNEADIEAALHQVLSQLPSASAVANLATSEAAEKNIPWLNESKKSQESDHSLSVEMAALQDLIDPKEDHSEHKVNISSKNSNKQSQWGEREFNEVIKEYEELERTLSQSNDNANSNSCDEQESIRSEADADFLNARASKKSNNIPVPSASATALIQTQTTSSTLNPSVQPEARFLDHLESLKSTSSSSLTISNRALNPSKTSKDQHQQFKARQETSSVASSHVPLKSIPSGTSKQFESNNRRPESPLKSMKTKTHPVPPKGSKSAIDVFGRREQSTFTNSDERPITPSSPESRRSPRTNANQARRFSGSGNQFLSSRNGGGGGEGATNFQVQQERNILKIEKLQAEVTRQETLISAFQEDNQKLYNELRTKEKEHFGKEAEWEEIVNSLKTDIATLKINRLVTSSPSRPSSAMKGELDRLREESATKSFQMTELRKEVILLRNNLAEATKSSTNKQGRAIHIAQEKEKESQKTIRDLNKQVRTLQKILYRKDPSAALSISKAPSRDNLYSSQELINPVSGKKDGHVAVLESRISDLESDLAKADEEAKDRLKDFQARLNGLKGRYEDQLKEYELRLEEAAVKIHTLEKDASQATMQELKSRCDKSQTEITHLKLEINKYKRELEIAQKSSVSNTVTQATAKQDAGTLSLAIKSFKAELAEKEKEIIRMKKEIADLNKTNNTLKREREKYLNLTNALSIPGSVPTNPTKSFQRTKSDMAPKGVSKKAGNNTNNEKEVGLEGLFSASRSPTRTANTGGAGSATTQLLHSALEYERTEFERLINHKKKEIEERDNIIYKLKQELEEIKSSKETDMDEYSKARMLSELRSRVSAQNDLISKLKDHIAYYRRIEGEYLRLKQDKGQTEVEIKELKQKLDLAQTLNRPENEVLELLSKKFDELNSRYLHRERQMDSLLNRLAVRTGASSLSPRLASSSGGHLDGEMGSSEFDLRQLSPSLSIHLLNAAVPDLPEV